MNRRILPGFGLSLGIAVAWLGLLVLLPLCAVVANAVGLGPRGFAEAALETRALAAYRLSFGAAATAAAIAAVAGLLVAWVLARHDFPGRRLADALVDLPFALPTAVAGLSLTALTVPDGWVGRWAAEFGVKIAFTPAGIVLALAFLGLPFVVRTVQPVVEALDRDTEEAAAVLGSSRARHFRVVVWPQIRPALLTGTTLAFARGLGEYGSVVFISGNMPFRTEIAPLLIVTKLEQFDYAGATAIATVMLAASFVLLLVLNLLQRRLQRGGLRLG